MVVTDDGLDAFDVDSEDGNRARCYLPLYN